MFEEILVPLDGSADAEAALAFVELMPSRRVRLLSVEPDDQGPMLADGAEVARWRAAREAEARAWLEPVAAALRRQGREVTVTFAFGDPAERIVAGAGSATTDLIAMSTHGRGAGGRAIFGSVADRVARHAPTATLIVRGGPRRAAPPPLTRVVVPLDGSAAAEAALPLAERLGGDLGVPIHLVRVAEPDQGREDRSDAADRPSPRPAAPSQEQPHAYLDRWSRTLRNRDLAATAEVLRGHPVPALLETIRAGDLVVLSTRGHGGVRRWLLGSVAEKLVRAAAAPILLVRAPGANGPATEAPPPD